MEGDKTAKLRHRIHQWSVVKFVEMLKIQPIDVDEVSESYTSSINPFNGEKLRKGKQVVEGVIKVFNPLPDDGHCSRWWGCKSTESGR